VGSMGLAERNGPVGRACGAAVTRFHLLELRDRTPTAPQSPPGPTRNGVGDALTPDRCRCLSVAYLASIRSRNGEATRTLPKKAAFARVVDAFSKVRQRATSSSESSDITARPPPERYQRTGSFCKSGRCFFEGPTEGYILFRIIRHHCTSTAGSGGSGGTNARHTAPSTQSLSTSRPARCGSSAPLPRAMA
jgi:hypothetical protein